MVPSRGSRRELRWIRDGALIALLAAPAILAPVFQINNGETSFITRPGLHAIGVFGWWVSGRTFTAIPPYAIGVIATLVAATTAWRKNLHSVDAFRYALLFLWAVLPAFVVMATSYLRPIWLDRYALWSTGALVVLVAYGLTRLANGRALAVVVLVAALLGVRGVVNWYREPAYEDYHALIGDLSPRLRPGDALIFSPDEVRIPAEFYLRPDIRRLELVPLFPPDPWGHFKTGQQHVSPFTEHTVALADPKRYPRIWLIAFNGPTTFTTRMVELNRRYRVASHHSYQGGVEILLLQARTTGGS